MFSALIHTQGNAPFCRRQDVDLSTVFGGQIHTKDTVASPELRRQPLAPLSLMLPFTPAGKKPPLVTFLGVR